MKRRRAISTLPLGALLLLGGCASNPTPPPLVAAGVSYELPSVAEELHIDDQRLYFRGHALDLRVEGRLIMLNGIPYGAVRRGDHVQLTPEGRLYVHGIERRPTPR